MVSAQAGSAREPLAVQDSVLQSSVASDRLGIADHDPAPTLSCSLFEDLDLAVWSMLPHDGCAPAAVHRWGFPGVHPRFD